MDKFKGKNRDFEIIEDSKDSEIDEIRLIDPDQLSRDALRILENEENEKIDIPFELFETIFMRIYKYFQDVFDLGSFIDDLHEECENEGLNISYTVLEISLSEAIEEYGEEIVDNSTKFFNAFIRKLKRYATIKSID